MTTAPACDEASRDETARDGSARPDAEPLAAEPVALDYASPSPGSARRWAWIVLWLALAACVLGTVAIWIEVESVLVSGLALLTAGV